MREDIKKRIEAVRRGEVPEGYHVENGYLIPNEWETVPLNSRFTRSTRKNSTGCENVLTISAQMGLVNQREFYDKDIASEDKSGYFLMKNGEFAYNKSYSTGYPYGAIKPLTKYDEGIVSPLYICFAPKTDTNTAFYTQYFEGGRYNREIYRIAQEGARNHGLLNVAVDYFFAGSLAEPDADEQQKIADILAICDRVIELKQQLLEEKRHQKQWLMQKLLDPNSGVRLPGYKGAWKKCKLGSLGGTYSGLSGKSEEDFGEGAPYIPYVNIFTNPIVDIDSFDYVRIGEEERQSRVQYGDIFFTTSSETPDEIGMSSVYLGEDQELYLNSFCFGFRLNGFDTLIPEYAAYCFRGLVSRKILYKLAQGATRYNLSKSDFMKQTIVLPPTTEEQKAIADILLTADFEIETIKNELELWQQKKKALMQLLLTGLVRVNA